MCKFHLLLCHAILDLLFCESIKVMNEHQRVYLLVKVNVKVSVYTYTFFVDLEFQEITSD